LRPCGRYDYICDHAQHDLWGWAWWRPSWPRVNWLSEPQPGIASFQEFLHVHHEIRDRYTHDQF
jgi:hypothetical protein